MTLEEVRAQLRQARSDILFATSVDFMTRTDELMEAAAKERLHQLLEQYGPIFGRENLE